MPKFRKKPIVIEAVRVSTLRNGADQSQWPEWLKRAWAKNKDVAGAVSSVGENALVHTLEGTMRAEPTDWIICGIQGEVYPCKADIFAATYDEMDA